MKVKSLFFDLNVTKFACFRVIYIYKILMFCSIKVQFVVKYEQMMRKLIQSKYMQLPFQLQTANDNTLPLAYKNFMKKWSQLLQRKETDAPVFHCVIRQWCEHNSLQIISRIKLYQFYYTNNNYNTNLKEEALRNLNHNLRVLINIYPF